MSPSLLSISASFQAHWTFTFEWGWMNWTVGGDQMTVCSRLLQCSAGEVLLVEAWVQSRKLSDGAVRQRRCRERQGERERGGSTKRPLKIILRWTARELQEGFLV